jgi:glucose-6-phosphate isomerase
MKSSIQCPGFRIDLQGIVNHPKSRDWNLSVLPKAWKQFREKTSTGKVGFYDWPVQMAPAEHDALKTCAEEIVSSFDGALLIGIGGSYLGAYSVMNALHSRHQPFPLHWVSNIDASSIDEAVVFARAQPSATVVISKSGNTIETLSAFYHLSEYLDPKGYVFITDPKLGELRRLSERYGWKSFPVPPNIGGRFSVLTAVGLLPLLLSGIDTDKILRGAREMREAFDRTSPEENPACLYALLCHRWNSELGANIHYLMPYEARLRSLADWFIQLWAESLGKKTRQDGRAVGFTPMGALGTSDQHSLLQLFKEGPQDKVIGFLDVLSEKRQVSIGKPKFETGSFEYLCDHTFEEISHLACLATEKSLNNSGVPTYRIELPNVTPEAIGAFLFFMEAACAVAGELYDIDAFNQPGVEEAKVLLRDAL